MKDCYREEVKAARIDIEAGIKKAKRLINRWEDGVLLEEEGDTEIDYFRLRDTIETIEELSKRLEAIGM